MYDTVRKAALDKANAVREALGFPPVGHLYKGEIMKHNSCPITNTIYDDDIDREKFFVSTGIDNIQVYDFDDTEVLYNGDRPFRASKLLATPLVDIEHSLYSSAFVSCFDRGEIEDLIA